MAQLRPRRKGRGGAVETILEDIERALDVGAFYLAIAVSVSLPDICGALETEDGASHPNRYKDWFARYLADELELSAEDLLSMRHGILHQGHFGSQRNLPRILFSGPGGKAEIHNIGYIIWPAGSPEAPPDQTLCLDTRTFCKTILKAVRRWRADSAENPNVQKNLPRLLRRRPEGLYPFIGDSEVIA